jgi:hypothetical protein
MVSYPGACLKTLRDGGVGRLKQAEWLSMYALARFPRPRLFAHRVQSDTARGENAAKAPLESFDESAALRDLIRLEDPTCYHKAVPPARAPRLVLQLLWGSGDFVAPGFSRRLSEDPAAEATRSGTDSAGFRPAT